MNIIKFRPFWKKKALDVDWRHESVMCRCAMCYKPSVFSQISYQYFGSPDLQKKCRVFVLPFKTLNFETLRPLSFLTTPPQVADALFRRALFLGKDELCGEQCVKHANFALHFVYSPIFRIFIFSSFLTIKLPSQDKSSRPNWRSKKGPFWVSDDADGPGLPTFFLHLECSASEVVRCGNLKISSEIKRNACNDARFQQKNNEGVLNSAHCANQRKSLPNPTLQHESK